MADCSSALFEQQGELHLDLVRDGFGVLPITLADAEIETLDRCRSFEPRASVLGFERELDRHVLRDVTQRELARRGVLTFALVGELLCDVIVD
jgi:hypothetical protein